MNEKKILIYGATGQSKMIRDIARSMYPFKQLKLFLVDETPGLTPPFSEYEEFRTGPKAFEEFFYLHECEIEQFSFAIAVGNPNGKRRWELEIILRNKGLQTQNWIHETAYVSESVYIHGSGNHVHPHAIINPTADIGTSCIINTRALVEHGCAIGNGVEIGPGAVLCGQIKIHNYAWVGANATILPNLTIGEGAIVGAGAVVTKDVPDGATVVGNPAKQLIK